MSTFGNFNLTTAQDGTAKVQRLPSCVPNFSRAYYRALLQAKSALFSSSSRCFLATTTLYDCLPVVLNLTRCLSGSGAERAEISPDSSTDQAVQWEDFGPRAAIERGHAFAGALP